MSKTSYAACNVDAGEEPRRTAYRQRSSWWSWNSKWINLLAMLGVLAIAVYLNCNDTSWPEKASSREQSPLPNVSLAETLEREVRIFCWVLTHPKNHKTKAVHIKQTWGRRCTRLLFVSTEPDDELDMLVLPVVEEYALIWAKTKRAFQYIHKHHRDEADWFIKTDDDTYLVMENLRYLLYAYSPETPIHFGHNFKLFGDQANVSYMSGGSGYVLSRAAMDLFVEVALQNSSLCRTDDGSHAEDVEIGMCLHRVGVLAGDGRDAHNTHRFLPFDPHYALISKSCTDDFWWYTYDYYHVRSHRDALSNYAASFHYIPAPNLYLYDFLNYEFDVFGLKKDRPEELPRRLSTEEIVIPPPDNFRATPILG